MFVSGLERVVFGGVGEGGPRLFIGGCFDAVSVGDLCVEIFFGGDPSDCSDGFGLGQVDDDPLWGESVGEPFYIPIVVAAVISVHGFCCAHEALQVASFGEWRGAFGRFAEREIFLGV